MSLLHFPAMAFATYAEKKTITSKSNKKVRGENIADLYAGMQDEDFYKLNVLYRCPGYEAEYSKCTIIPKNVFHFNSSVEFTCLLKECTCLKSGAPGFV